MTFAGKRVWVRMDAHGKPVQDAQSRGEMKYAEDSAKIYRPSVRNLAPVGATEQIAPAAHTPERAPKRAPRRDHDAEHAQGDAQGDTIDVWTDGACTGNPGPMGIGIVIVIDGAHHEHSEFLGQGTNNIAELVAIQRGLESVRKLVPKRTKVVRVFSDSSYALGVLGQGWKAKANRELVMAMREQLAESQPVTLIKVAGHAGVGLNERCDELARQATQGRK
jgi:ribonuclease HI